MNDQTTIDYAKADVFRDYAVAENPFAYFEYLRSQGPIVPLGKTAIDFNFDFEREANAKGDRVKITMSGKFLPYKYYGNEQGIPDYGFKETE